MLVCLLFVCLFVYLRVCVFVVCQLLTIDLDIGRQFERGVVDPCREVQQFKVGSEDVVVPRCHIYPLLRGRIRVFSTKRIKFNWPTDEQMSRKMLKRKKNIDQKSFFNHQDVQFYKNKYHLMYGSITSILNQYFLITIDC